MDNANSSRTKPLRAQRPLSATIYGVVLFSIVFSVDSIANQNLFWGPLYNSAHAFVFFFMAQFLISVFIENDSKDSGAKLSAIAGTCFATGIVIELAQPFFGRDSSFTDIYFNFIGIMSAIAFEVSKYTQLKRKISIRVVACLVLFSALTVPLIGASTISDRNTKMPVLLDFEDNWQTRLYRAGGEANLSIAKAPKGWGNLSNTLKVTYATSKYPGFNVAHVTPNWTLNSTSTSATNSANGRSLRFDVFSKNTSKRKITLRIHDAEHTHAYDDRFNRTFIVQPGSNTYSIPLSEVKRAPSNRTMDLTNIAGFAIFSANPEEEFALYFDDFKLE